MFEKLTQSAKDYLDLSADLHSNKTDRDNAFNILTNKLIHLRKLEHDLSDNKEEFNEEAVKHNLKIEVIEWSNLALENPDIDKEAEKFANSEKDKIYKICIAKVFVLYMDAFRKHNKDDDLQADELINFQIQFFRSFGLILSNKGLNQAKKIFEDTISKCGQYYNTANFNTSVETISKNTIDSFFGILAKKIEEHRFNKTYFNNSFSIKTLRCTVFSAFVAIFTIEAGSNFIISKTLLNCLLGASQSEKNEKLEL